MAAHCLCWLSGPARTEEGLGTADERLLRQVTPRKGLCSTQLAVQGPETRQFPLVLQRWNRERSLTCTLHSLQSSPSALASRPCCPEPVWAEQRNQERSRARELLEHHPLPRHSGTCSKCPLPGHSEPFPTLPLGRPPMQGPGRKPLPTTYLNLPQDIQAFRDLPKYHMLAVQPICLITGQEELGAIGVRARIGHGEETWEKINLSASSTMFPAHNACLC